MKVLSIFGTRPEAIKMAPIIKALKTHFGDDAKVCVTGQHRLMLDQILNLFSISPDYDLNIMRKNQSLNDITTSILKKLRSVFKSYSPDIIFVHGDTTTTLAASLAAFYEKIEVWHVEAGLRSENIYSPWPEELNRRITSLIATHHFAPTVLAAENLQQSGISSSKITITGNTVVDALNEINNHLINNTSLLTQLEQQFQFLNFEKKIVLVTGHRRENFGEGFRNICEALALIAQQDGVHIVYPVHLNPNVRKPVYHLLGKLNNISLIEPLDYLSFVYLMKRCYLILTDSGGIQEEAPSLQKPVLVMRNITERPEGINTGIAKLVGADKNTIVQETLKVLENPGQYKQMTQSKNPYGDGKAAQRIVAKLLELKVNSFALEQVMV
jgi:UDP-N-acetylglucosamine 2-epimerase (non-hydrolysing)